MKQRTPKPLPSHLTLAAGIMGMIGNRPADLRQTNAILEAADAILKSFPPTTSAEEAAAVLMQRATQDLAAKYRGYSVFLYLRARQNYSHKDQDLTWAAEIGHFEPFYSTTLTGLLEQIEKRLPLNTTTTSSHAKD